MNKADIGPPLCVGGTILARDSMATNDDAKMKEALIAEDWMALKLRKLLHIPNR